MTAYRNDTHTDQHSHYTSHHPLQHKLGVPRMLYERSGDIGQTLRIRRKKYNKSILLRPGVDTPHSVSEMSNRNWITRAQD